MFAIAFLFFILLYLLIGILISVGIIKLFNVKGAKKTIIIVIVFIFMLGLIFWDWLPMEISYKNKCDNEAGLTIYKTLDDWKKENPGVWETLSRRALPEKYLVKEQMYEKKGDVPEHGERYYQLPDGSKLEARFNVDGSMRTLITRKDGGMSIWLNQRFVSDHIITQYWFHINKREDRIVDVQTNEILIKYINFRTNIHPLGLGIALADYKFWMRKKSCEKGMYPKNKIKYNGFLQILKNIGSN